MWHELTENLKDHPLRRFFAWREDHRFDWISPACMLLLAIIGIFFIYSAQSYSGGSSWKMQIIWVFLGGAVYFGVSLINYKFFLENAHYLYWLCLLLLIPLVIQSVGGVNIPLVRTEWGSTRWISLGRFTIQPSEIAKIGTLVMVAGILARSEIGGVQDSIKVLIKVGLAVSLPVLLIFLQPDLGSSLVFPPMVFAMLYISNLSERFFAAVFVLFLAGMVVVGFDIYSYQQYLERQGISAAENTGGYQDSSLLPLKDYQRNRILAFVAPQIVDPKGNGVSWNLNQSLIAVAGGGFAGKGLGEGTQAKLGYLPSTVAHNDFIFSVLAEESGFLGGVIVIFLFTVLIANGIRIAGLSRDRFGTLLAVGASMIFLVHIFINIGMTIGLMPITGLPLPFLSYGGSFVLSCCILQGIIQSVYRYKKDFT